MVCQYENFTRVLLKESRTYCVALVAVTLAAVTDLRGAGRTANHGDSNDSAKNVRRDLGDGANRYNTALRVATESKEGVGACSSNGGDAVDNVCNTLIFR